MQEIERITYVESPVSPYQREEQLLDRIQGLRRGLISDGISIPLNESVRVKAESLIHEAEATVARDNTPISFTRNVLEVVLLNKGLIRHIFIDQEKPSGTSSTTRDISS